MLGLPPSSRKTARAVAAIVAEDSASSLFSGKLCIIIPTFECTKLLLHARVAAIVAEDSARSLFMVDV
jgi:hypothetical protein